MIHSLQKKWIRICAISVLIVFSVILLLSYIMSTSQLNMAMDELNDRIAENNGEFPFLSQDDFELPEGSSFFNFFTEETPFSTRFFTVEFDSDGNISGENIEYIASVSAKSAREYAQKALDSGSERGWIRDYRYKVYATDDGSAVVFVDGSTNRSVSRMVLLTVGTILLLSGIIILILIILFSRKALKPVAESYEKQKQFITDANHELKTPLTLILTNLDIAESEVGKNEWLEDIRAEGKRMHALVNELVTLTRMDEDGPTLAFSSFNFSQALSDTVSEFYSFAGQQGETITTNIEENIFYNGNEESIRKLFSILLDNAVKYCDPGGEIEIRLLRKKTVTFHVLNTFSEVDHLELNRLFDRFYRSDKSRTYQGGFGIGLSIAQAIVQKHHGQIHAYQKNHSRIGFKVTLK